MTKQSIVVKKNSFIHTTSLKICNNEHLNIITIKNSDKINSKDNVEQKFTFGNVKSVIIESMLEGVFDMNIFLIYNRSV